MHQRQDIGLLTCSGMIALVILGVITKAPLLPTLYIVGLFVISAIGIHYFALKRHTRRAKFDSLQKKSRSGLMIWTQVIDAMPNACVLIDKDKRIIHANKEAKSLAKIESFGRLFTSYIRGPNLNLALDRALSGESSDVIDIHRSTPAEQYLRIRFTSKTLQRQSTQQRYLLATISDITEDKISETQKADFLANASHELKTPIASLIDDLLSLRKIEQSQHIIPNEYVDLNQSIIAAIEALKPIADKKGASLSYINPGVALTLGQSDETVQLLLNLIGNAIKFTPEGQKVDIRLNLIKEWAASKAFENASLQADTGISTRRIVEYAQNLEQDGVWQIQIRDWGRGFSREHLPRIGERFYRIAGDLSSTEKGTGLGLAIVKHIVIRHRAGLYIRSQSNVGTEFTLIMPNLKHEKNDKGA